MALYEEFISLDQYFKNTTGDKIILNDVELGDDATRSNLVESIYTTYNSDTISMIPSCDCGELTGAILLGKLCHSCNTVVKEPFEKTDPFIWLNVLKPDVKFMDPFFWLMLRTAISKNFDTLRWVSDTTYNPPNTPDFILDIANTIPNFTRNYTYLVNNLETIIVHILNSPKFKTKKRALTLIAFLELYRRDKDKLYHDTVPVINKKLFVMENTSKGKYTNLGVAKVIDLIMYFVKVVQDKNISDRKLSTTMGVVHQKLADIYDSFYRNYAATKPGIFRKHIYGARSHFTFRSVITSIGGPHNYDEIHVPWGVGVTVYRPHLLNLLKKRGYSYKKSSMILFEAIKSYSDLVNECLQELIDNARDKKLYVNIQRNPSLARGSSIRVYISKFKTDIDDNALGISDLVCSLMNADSKIVVLR